MQLPLAPEAPKALSTVGHTSPGARIFVDDAAIVFRGKPRFHLMAATVPELHEFCRKAGINRCWFHNTKNAPHYDITSEQREKAIALGAVPVRFRDIRRRANAANQAETGAMQGDLLD